MWTLAAYQREIESPNSNLLVLSISSSEEQYQTELEKIIAFGSFWQILEEAHIAMLMVHPDWQHQGLGQLLLCALLKEACGCKLERATLEVKASNQAALSLYQKFGFQIAGRRKGYYQATDEDALILWRGGLQYPEFQTNLPIWQQQIRARLAHHHWQFP
jgi:ribosomal-protein-alanine N-acetyltransferase